jgi:arylsulfatase A-like enzyme
MDPHNSVGSNASSAMPKHVVVVLLDSLNRHMLGAYGGTEFTTPNLDRFANQSVVFESHHTGSLPCMPARHDLLVGAMDFLWRPWGSVEIWEDAITFSLRQAGVTTMLVSDHPHLFECGGENYHIDFDAWEYVRGHENDPWKTRPDPSWVGTPALPVDEPRRGHFKYQDSRTWFKTEEDFPGPRTMQAAVHWMQTNGGHHDRSLLVIDEFDPHEPFDTPEPWASMYRAQVDDPQEQDPWMIWPPYVIDGLKNGLITEAEGRSLRAAYGAKLSMIDHWFGKLLDAIDESPDATETVVIICTDHGHYLGEFDVWGKPGFPIHNTLGHIPMMIRWPGISPRREKSLTTTVDIHATLCEVFGVEVEHRTHGRSLVPLVNQEVTRVRDHCLSGYWGREVQLITEDHTYTRGSVGDGFPLSMWSNRWSTMPVHSMPHLRLPRPDQRAYLDAMPGSSVPVIRQPFMQGDFLPFWAYGGLKNENLLFDCTVDPGELNNLAAAHGSELSEIEQRLVRKLEEALLEINVPDDVLERLGLHAR